MDEPHQEVVDRTTPVLAPEWGGSVRVRALPREELKQLLDAPGKYGLLAALCIVDENGERLYSDDDAEELGKKSAAALERIWRAVALISAGLPMPPSYYGSAVSVGESIYRFHDELDRLQASVPMGTQACRPVARARTPRRRARAGARRTQARGDPSSSGSEDDDPHERLVALERLLGGAR